MNEQSVADLVYEVNVKTQSVALCAPSFEAALNSTTTTGITAGFRPSYSQRELPTEKGKEVGAGGFVWLSNNVLSLVERLPRKSRPSVRSVLLAYAQLSSRRGNARTFPAAAGLVARMAGCSISTVHLADKILRDAGLITISLQKVQGRDVPRLVTLVEVAAAPPIPYEIVSADDIPSVRQYRRRQSKSSSDTGVRLAVCNSDTLKKPSKEKLSLSTRLAPSVAAPAGSRGGERNGWDLAEGRLAEEHGLTLAEVQKHRARHEANMAAGRAAGRVQGYPTTASLGRYLESLPKPTKAAPMAEKAATAMKKAEAERTQCWEQFTTANTNTPSRYEEADTETRLAFAVSNEGARFRNLAESRSNGGRYYTLNEETCELVPSRL